AAWTGTAGSLPGAGSAAGPTAAPWPGGAATPGAGATSAGAGTGAAWPGGPDPTAGQWPARPARVETSPQQVQNTLLTLGALLLGAAGVVFTAVTYSHVGVVGRALILLALTAA